MRSIHENIQDKEICSREGGKSYPVYHAVGGGYARRRNVEKNDNEKVHIKV